MYEHIHVFLFLRCLSFQTNSSRLQFNLRKPCSVNLRWHSCRLRRRCAIAISAVGIPSVSASPLGCCAASRSYSHTTNTPSAHFKCVHFEVHAILWNSCVYWEVKIHRRLFRMSLFQSRTISRNSKMFSTSKMVYKNTVGSRFIWTNKTRLKGSDKLNFEICMQFNTREIDSIMTWIKKYFRLSVFGLSVTYIRVTSQFEILHQSSSKEQRSIFCRRALKMLTS